MLLFWLVLTVVVCPHRYISAAHLLLLPVVVK